MSTFGIFAAVLTFVYVVYYAVIISMDLMGDKGKKKTDVEVFAVESSADDSYEEQPTYVREDDPPLVVPSEQDKESGEAMMTSKIMDADEEELYAKDKEMAKVVAESDGEVSSDDMEKRLALLDSEDDKNLERMGV